MSYAKIIKSHKFKIGRGLTTRLVFLDIELTERCNNDCIHCFINLPANDRAAKAREMTTGQVKSILTEAAALGCLTVRFTGGEPLLRPDFEDLYLFARRLGLKVLIFTNACLITPQLADLLARIPPLEFMEITVYGMHKESYEAVSRVPGSFAQFKRGVNLLLDRKIPFIVKSALLPPNKAEMDEFEAWANTISWMDKSPDYSIFFNLRTRRDDEKKNALITSLRSSPEEVVAVVTRDAAKYRTEMGKFVGKFMNPPSDALFRCGAGNRVCIDAYGFAQPCMGVRAPELTVDLFSEAALGKAMATEHEETAIAMNKVCDESGYCERSEAISEALASFKNLHKMKATNPDYLRRCAVCFLKVLCEQCPANSWAEHRTLDTPVEYLCEVAHAEARWMGWLKDREKAWEVLDWKERVKG
ncbi:MAG: radical SAM protein [Smithella sp.]|jgi:MoaA/NifB/PqqE/SkfB family radical SAM enzyme